MSGYPNGDWHNANGRGLPYRPPTVDEALPYSPFTSIVPFSPDVIPFPVNEPPTPPTTLTPEQQTAGRTAVGILNEEIQGPSFAAQHLEHTMRELRSLLGDPREMTEFHFKPTAQLATPPPDSPTKPPDETTPTSRPKLSPFAAMLLKQTEVHYQPEGIPAPQQPKPKPEAPRPRASIAPSCTSSQQMTPNQPNSPHVRNGAVAHASSTPIPSSASSQARPHPAVIIKPSTAPKHEFRRYDNIPDDDGDAQQRSLEPLDYLATLRPQEREVAEQKIAKLRHTVDMYHAAKDELESDHFERISCLDSDITVMTRDTLDSIYNKVMLVYARKCFGSVSVETIVKIHALCEPLITAADQPTLFSEEEMDSWTSDFRIVELGLRSARLALTAMLEGPPDRRTSPEDLLTAIIQTVKRVLDTCIFPVLASRRDHNMFGYATNHKEEMTSVLRLCTGVQALLAQAIRKVALPDSALNAVEFLALALLLEKADSEKDSVLGIQAFEKLRRTAMDVLTNIFASRHDHRHYILGEILNSLEKLPEKGPHVRQFKSVGEQPIMTVSAIFMQFIQIAATNIHCHDAETNPDSEQEENVQEKTSDSEYESDRPRPRKSEIGRGKKSVENIIHRLRTDVQHIANRIVHTLIERALNASKTAEKMFRNLLDMFVDDFCAVLGSPEWPAANLLLVPLVNRLLTLLKEKSHREITLSILGTVGCGIIDFKKRIRQLKRDVDFTQSDLSAKLHRLAEDALADDDATLKRDDLLTLKDPYQMVIESLPDYLKVNDDPENLHLLSVRGCQAYSWMDTISRVMRSKDDGAADSRAIGDVRKNVESMILDPKWSSREYKYQNVSEAQSRLAAGITTLKSTFCQSYYPHIVYQMFIQLQQDGGASQKTTAIRNIKSFLNKDPHSVSEKYINFLVRMLSDSSAMVRDTVLLLITDTLDSHPAMERLCFSEALRLTTDSHNGPKKRAVTLLKAIYNRSASLDTKIQIVTALLPASQDPEKLVADMARQALEEVWLKVPDRRISCDENQLKLQRAERVSLIVQTVKKILPSPRSMQAFENFFAAALAKGTANVSTNFQICKDLVTDLADGVISPDSMASGYTQDAGLQTLSIFARASPEMFSLEQIQRLKLYVIAPKTADDVEILRSTVTIFRCVIPHLQDLPAKFADDVWKLLSEAIAKLARSAANGNITGKETLVGVVHCLWIMRTLATNGTAKLLAVVGSTLVQLVQLVVPSSDPSAQEAQKKRIMPLLVLIGTFGKVCDWSEDAAHFHSSVAASAKKTVTNKPSSQEQLKNLLNPTGSAPSVMLLEAVRPFTKQPWDLSIRESALCAVGEVCQGSPSLFQRSDVETTFKVVFKNDIGSLKQIALSQFHDFLVKAEKRSEHDPVSTGENAANGSGRLGITFQAGDGQITTNYLARKFLQEIVDIALQNDSDLALVATNTIVSISRQGLVHPKEVGPALIALGSSSNPRISEAAATEHREIHSKHETMFEKEYMIAVRMAFEYQQNVFRDPHGMTEPPDCKPKMAHVFNVMKNGTRKTVKRFIDNLSKLVDFDLSKFDDPDASLDALLFARFCLENLALFDVAKVEDVAIITNALENIVLKNTGPTVGVVIDTEMPKKATAPPQSQQLDNVTGDSADLHLPMKDATRDDPGGTVSDDRLLQITRASMILQMMWDTRCFVRKAYNFSKPGRISQKAYQNAAVRNNFVKGQELWESFENIFIATNDRKSMIDHCYEFADLLEVDKDLHVGGEEAEEEDGEGYATPGEAEEPETAVPTSGRGRKRKSSAPLTSTPKKARGRPAGGKSKKRNSGTPEGDDWD